MTTCPHLRITIHFIHNSTDGFRIDHHRLPKVAVTAEVLALTLWMNLETPPCVHFVTALTTGLVNALMLHDSGWQDDEVRGVGGDSVVEVFQVLTVVRAAMISLSD